MLVTVEAGTCCGMHCSKCPRPHDSLPWCVPLYLCTRYPSLIIPGFLYLGDWGDAEQQERLQELKIKRCGCQGRAG